MKKRIGLFGSSFDPIHNGHLILTNCARFSLKLDEIHFIPCFRSAYLHKIFGTTMEDRLNMLNMAISDEDKICHYELKRKGISYTIDTVKYYKEIYPNDDIFFIAGPDSTDKFALWRDSKEIKKLVSVRFGEKDFYVPKIEIRSTLIRKLILNGRSIKYLVPEKVEEYIIKHNLYKG